MNKTQTVFKSGDDVNKKSERFGNPMAVTSRGMSDEELEALARPGFSGPLASFSGIVSRLHWASEMYSHGKTFRFWLRWPDLLPLPFFSDHGVYFSRNLEGPELTNEAKLHLTWSQWRTNRPIDSGKRVLRVPHPYVYYRRQLGLVPKHDASGVAIFVPHSLPGHSATPYRYDAYLSELQRLDREIKPRAFVLAMHDIHAGLHKALRPIGLPILTAGNTDHPDFVDNLYKLLSNFRLATSNRIGSQAFFAEELGVPYFIWGKATPRPSSVTAQLGRNGQIRRGIVQSAFRGLESIGAPAKHRWVERALSLDIIDDASRREQVRREVSLQLLSLPTQVARRLSKKVSQLPSFLD